MSSRWTRHRFSPQSSLLRSHAQTTPTYVTPRSNRSFDSLPAHPGSSISAQVDTVTRPARVARHPLISALAHRSQHYHTDAPFRFRDPAISDDVSESVKPHSELPFTLTGAVLRRGVPCQIGKGPGKLDDHQNRQHSPERCSLPLPSLTSYLPSRRSLFSLRAQNEFVSMSTTQSCSPSQRQRSLSPPPGRAPPLHLETKPRFRSSDDPTSF